MDRSWARTSIASSRLRGNEGWHTDSSYMPLAAKASVLSAQVVPSAGGETEWADMRAAYDALDEATRRRIAGLSAHHSLYHSQAKIGHVVQTGAGYGFHTKGAPLRPLVKVHPVTGRPALFIGRHAYGIPGLDEARVGEAPRRTSSTSPAGRPGRTRIGGSRATWSSGTTAACCTGLGRTTTARCASCVTPASRATRPPSWRRPIATTAPARTSRPPRTDRPSVSLARPGGFRCLGEASRREEAGGEDQRILRAIRDHDFKPTARWNRSPPS